MKSIIITDPEKCRQAWEKYWPVQDIFDLWAVRQCFNAAFNRPLSFHLIEDKGQIVGFLPLSRVEETGEYVFFPGETWKGKTWLEQNRVLAHSPEVFQALCESVPGPLNLRYLRFNPLFDKIDQAGPDETGYLFYPRMHDFSMENFWLAFPGKTRKKLKADVKKIEERQLSWRYNHMPDITELFRLNMAAFTSDSYFSDARFYRSFERFAVYLRDMGMLRITTAIVEGKIAAVDMGAFFNNTYTVVAGGTHPDFVGIAKVINLHHLEWACHNRMEAVDFLCGSFTWKERFRLSPRPSYEIHTQPETAVFHGGHYGRKAV
ncbi:GNAT family N-acetyltransferase [Desulfobacter sp.]|uniref:GNAT family N-acetyltransferase n=1 Tax=Desulfobacter sp. TaxID=2294 RepID=UPI000E9876D3|nr:GNAT family N-acetyltransferase [Desulfobacter sp.]HBT87008.1 cellulose biosynthesis protein CelD [Desulfobacter sp.]